MPTSFQTIVEVSERVAANSSRREKVALLANLLQQVDPDELEIVTSFLAGVIRQGKTGVGYSTLTAKIAQPAESPALLVHDVDRTFQQLASVQGRGSAEMRSRLLHHLQSRATAPEQRFLTALLTGELRQGALEGIMVDAIAQAAGLEPERVRRAVMMAGNFAKVARTAMESGTAGLEQYSIQLFRPVHPMLAQTSEDPESAVEELGDSALEFKVDGARIQVHRSGDDVRVYTRSLNDVTDAVPEVVEAARALPGKTAILDGEVIALGNSGRPLPFQVTMRRFGRRLDLDRMRLELPLHPFWFDLLYLDGQSLIDEAQFQRFDELQRLSQHQNVIPHIRTADPEAASRFLQLSLASGHEGIMAKAAESVYAAGARGLSWRKIKRAHFLDLVILAAEWGSGRRRGWLSNLHLGARDTERGGFAMLGKTFKGLTDQLLEWQTAEFLKREIARDAHVVYVKPELVVEIAFNDVQTSPRYPSGFALRFARVKRYRPDKSVEDSDTFDTVKSLAVSAER